ncbi:MAG: Ppx/GppA family phosphatase, partial [Pseudomonadota bacterium]
MAPMRPDDAGAIPPRGETGSDQRPAAKTNGVEPTASSPSRGSPLYAALDLGTNSCRMLIARPTGHQFTVVDSFSKAVQLGAGLETTGRLSRTSMGRTVQAMRICKQKLKHHK